jgi:hypothetical protein
MAHHKLGRSKHEISMNVYEIVEGWGADEITPYQNGYTIWHRKQSLEKGMLPYWLYKTPEEFSNWDDSMKRDLEKAIKKEQPVAKLSTMKDVVDIMNLEKEAHGNSKVYDKCWKGYKKVPGKKRGEKGSCVKETATSGGTSAGGIASVAANGFASGGIGTLSRAGTVTKKKKKKTKS